MDLENSTQKLAIAKRALDEANPKLKQLEDKKLAVEELKRKEARLKRQHSKHDGHFGFAQPTYGRQKNHRG